MTPLRFCILACAIALTGCAGSVGTDYYVSQSGNDDWSGHFADPNTGGTDGPFATLERAQEAVRQSIASGELVDGPIRVSIREGVYKVSSTLELTLEDSGTRDAPVIWRAYDDEVVVLSGGHHLRHWAPVAGGPGSDRIPVERQKSIFVADLPGEGVTDLGSFSDEEGPGLEIFVDGRRMQRARYPNEGFLEIAGVPQSGDSLIQKGSFQWQREGIPVGRHFGKFRIDDPRLATWAPSPDIWMHGYYVWDWRDGFQGVKSIDGRTGMVYAAPPYHSYGFSKGQRLYFFNVLEELDQPGEWVLDFENGLIYLWPGGKPDDETITVSQFNGPAFSFSDASFVHIEGLIFEYFRGSVVEIEDGEAIQIQGNVIRNIGRTPVSIKGGTAHRIRSNDFRDLGSGGVEAEGGDRMTLSAANHVIENNLFERFGQVRKTNVPGIRLAGVGITAAHNELTDSPDAGIMFFGNDMTLEYNEIHRIAKESDDVGAMYIGRDYSMRGNVIRYNYLHHLQKPMTVGVMGVYLDDFASGVKVYGNVFYKAGRCVFMGGGRRNHVESNIFVECSPSIFLDARGKVRNTEFFDGRITVLKDRLDAVHATEPPYSERYPELADLYEDDPAMPKYNRILNNVSMGGTWLGLFSGLPVGILDMHGNVISDPVVLQSSQETGVETEDFEVHPIDGDPAVDEIRAVGNEIDPDPPGRLDPSSGIFTWSGDSTSPLDTVPFAQIGLYVDDFRITEQ